MDTAHDFTVRLQELLRRERFALADFLVALAEFDQRRLWSNLGHASFFYFLHRELGLSKGAAYYRQTAAELIQQFPQVLEPLRDGRLCLTTVVELSKVLAAGNCDEVLPRFFHLSKSEAKQVSAEIRPNEAAPRRDVVTVARVPVVEPALALAGASPDLGHVAVHPANQLAGRHEIADRPTPAPLPAACQQAAPASTRPTVEPLTAELNRLHLTVSREFLKKLEAARAALSHSHPGAGAQEILEAGLDLLLERHARSKALVKKPRRTPPPSKPDHVPAHVLRAVWRRDGGQCQWPLASGGICGSTLRVEVDHRIARARGGPPTIDNLRCICRAHNDVAAREVFGDAWMDRYTRGRRARATVCERQPAAP